MKEVIEALQGAALQVVKEMKTADLMKYLQRDDGVVSTGLNDLILQMEHQIQGNDFTEDERSRDAKDIIAQYTRNPGGLARRQGESMIDYVDRRIKQYKLLKLKDPDEYVPEVTRTLVMVQQARTPMGVSLDLQRLVRKGEMRFEEAAKELVERFAKIHKKERQHLRISSRVQEDTNTLKKNDQEDASELSCNIHDLHIRDLQAVKTGGIMIDGLWRPFPPGYRFDTYKWSSRRQEFRLRSTRLTSTELVAAAKKEAKNMGQNSSRLLSAHYTTPEVNHLGQVIGPPRSTVVSQEGQAIEPSDNQGCEYCREPCHPFPYPDCWYCKAAPSYHHGRCCPEKPKYSAASTIQRIWRYRRAQGQIGLRKEEDEEPSFTQGIQRTVFMAVKTKAPPPHVCCVACDKVCDTVKWSKDDIPVPTCGGPCLLSYYSKKGLIDGIDLEGLTEEMSIKKIEDYIFLDLSLIHI